MICPTCREEYPEYYVYCPKDSGVLTAQVSKPTSAYDWVQSRPETLKQARVRVDTTIEKLPQARPATEPTRVSENRGLAAIKLAVAILAADWVIRQVVDIIFSIFPYTNTSLALDKFLIVLLILARVPVAFFLWKFLKKPLSIWLKIAGAVLAGLGASRLHLLVWQLHYLFTAQFFGDGADFGATIDSLTPKMNKLGIACAFLAWRLLDGKWLSLFQHFKDILTGQKSQTTGQAISQSSSSPDKLFTEESATVSPILIYAITALPGALFGYLLAYCCYILFTGYFFAYNEAAFYIEPSPMQSISNGLRTELYTLTLRNYFLAGNFFQRVHVAIGAGAALAAVLMLPSARRATLLKLDRAGLIIRANCVSICTNLAMSAFFFLNFFREKLSWDTAKQGIPVYWTETFIGIGAFLIAHHLFLKTKDVEAPIDPRTRGLTKSKPGDVYLPEPPKPRNADSIKQGGEANGGT